MRAPPSSRGASASVPVAELAQRRRQLRPEAAAMPPRAEPGVQRRAAHEADELGRDLGRAGRRKAAAPVVDQVRRAAGADGEDRHPARLRLDDDLAVGDRSPTGTGTRRRRRRLAASSSPDSRRGTPRRHPAAGAASSSGPPPAGRASAAVLDPGEPEGVDEQIHALLTGEATRVEPWMGRSPRHACRRGGGAWTGRSVGVDAADPAGDARAARRAPPARCPRRYSARGPSRTPGRACSSRGRR